MPLEIRTSDRNSYRRCRRKWDFSSPLRQNLIRLPEFTTPNPSLWFGSGVHFALEDYHGYRNFSSPIKAFNAYKTATKREFPLQVTELAILAEGMLENYILWDLKNGDTKTVWNKGVPLVEVDFSFPLLGFDNKPLLGPNGEEIVYSGIIDRVVEDPNGRIWLVDYKTASKFNTSKLEMDSQVTSYCLAYREVYGVEPEGMIYIQMLKSFPSSPRILKNGTISTDKTQSTNYVLYRKALLERYIGDVTAIPPDNLEYCEWLKGQEDKYIRRDLVRRNSNQLDSEYEKIISEAREMVSNQLPIYPNPTRDCGYDCDFIGPCVAMDDGSDYQHILANGYETRKDRDQWRQHLPQLTEQELKNLFS